MGEEHEFLVDLNKKERKGSTDDGGGDSAKTGASSRDDTKAGASTRDDAGNSGSGLCMVCSYKCVLNPLDWEIIRQY